MRHRKLDKNLKDDNQIDLLRYLQEKQLKQRRMSHCLISISPMGSNSYLNSPTKQKVNADIAMVNYKRRLSLATPMYQGSESPHMPAPPHRRKLRKSHTVGFDPNEQSDQELLPLVQGTVSPSSVESSPSKSDIGMMPVICEMGSDDELEENDIHKETKSRRSRLQKAVSIESSDQTDSPSMSPDLQRQTDGKTQQGEVIETESHSPQSDKDSIEISRIRRKSR